MDTNKMRLNKRTLDKGYVTFDNRIRAERWNEILTEYKIPFVRYLTIADGRTYYAFKMFYIKKDVFSLCIELEEVLSL